MPDSLARAAVARTLLPVAERAAQAILDVYETDFTVMTKDDDSPLTRADQASHAVIAAALAEEFPDVPVLSEEGAHPPHAERARWTRLFLVDPLDGTKEFVKRNGEFCVNIALVEGTRPVLGVIHVPVRGVVYWGGPALGAFRRGQDGQDVPVAVAPPGPGGAVMLTSRSHPSAELAEFAARQGIRDVRPAGAAFKFCRMAEGAAHVYPRTNPTMEWDTAAGHAILEGAGGSLTEWDGSPFGYNKPSLVNGGFIALAGMTL